MPQPVTADQMGELAQVAQDAGQKGTAMILWALSSTMRTDTDEDLALYIKPFIEEYYKILKQIESVQKGIR